MSTCPHCVRLTCDCGWSGYRTNDDDRPCPWCWRTNHLTALPVEHRLSSSKHYRAPPLPVRCMIVRKDRTRWRWVCVICAQTGTTHFGGTDTWKQTYGNAVRHCRNRYHHHKWAMENIAEVRRLVANLSKKGRHA